MASWKHCSVPGSICLLGFVLFLVAAVTGCSETTPGPAVNQTGGNQSADTDSDPVGEQGTSPGTSAPTASLDLSYIPSTALAAFVLSSESIMQSEVFQLYPIEVLEIMSTRTTGVNVKDVQQAIVLLQMSGNAPVPAAGAIVRLAKAYQLNDLFPVLKINNGRWKQVQIGEHLVLQLSEELPGSAPMDFQMTMPDPQTVLIGINGFLSQMLTAKDEESPLLELLAKVDANDEIVAVASADMLPEPLKQVMVNPNLVPAPFGKYVAALKYLSALEVTVQVGSQWSAELVLHAHDPNEAEVLQAVIKEMVSLAKQMLLSQMGSVGSGDEMIDAAMIQYQARVGNYLEALFQPTRDANRLTMTSSATMGIASTGVMVALLLPAVQAARNAARRMSSANNLKQIGIALHNYHETFKGLPVGETENIKFKDGKPLLSWRVHLLPFLDEYELYDQFKFDEPWNSPHNIKLLDQIPQVYVSPRHDLGNQTIYLAPEGPRTVLGSGKPVRFRDVTDGTSQTIAVIEAGVAHAVPWTKPQDLALDPDDPVTSIGVDGESFETLLLDCSVVSLSTTITAETFKRLIQRDDGQPVNLDRLTPGAPKVFEEAFDSEESETTRE